jgi:hypothetical protein
MTDRFTDGVPMNSSKPLKSIRAGNVKATLVLIGLVSSFGCQPEDVQPGLWLDGDLVQERIADWQFCSAVEEVFIETRTWYGIPHSTTIWSVVLGGDLYIGSYGEEKKTWEANIAANANARLRISGRLYEVVVTPVANPEVTAAVNESYHQKYDMGEVFGNEIPDWWFYQVTQR